MYLMVLLCTAKFESVQSGTVKLCLLCSETEFAFHGSSYACNVRMRVLWSSSTIESWIVTAASRCGSGYGTVYHRSKRHRVNKIMFQNVYTGGLRAQTIKSVIFNHVQKCQRSTPAFCLKKEVERSFQIFRSPIEVHRIIFESHERDAEVTRKNYVEG